MTARGRLAQDCDASEILGDSVSRETVSRLRAYVELLGRWRLATNLISEASFAEVWTRHIADCAQLLSCAPSARRWLDMGSGAGFPGLVIAIQLAEVDGARVHLVESDQRKCAFLREAIRVSGAPALVHAARVESLALTDMEPIEALTARAFAPLPRLLQLSGPWLNAGATGIFPRGRIDTRRSSQTFPHTLAGEGGQEERLPGGQRAAHRDIPSGASEKEIAPCQFPKLIHDGAFSFEWLPSKQAPDAAILRVSKIASPASGD